MELRDAAEKISAVMFTSHTRLHQLEKLTEAPAAQPRRALAYLAMLVYGFDPAELGLSEADLPKGLRVIEVADLLGELRGRDSNPQPSGQLLLRKLDAIGAVAPADIIKFPDS